jgi:hypothetical protein
VKNLAKSFCYGSAEAHERMLAEPSGSHRGLMCGLPRPTSTVGPCRATIGSVYIIDLSVENSAYCVLRHPTSGILPARRFTARASCARRSCSDVSRGTRSCWPRLSDPRKPLPTERAARQELQPAGLSVRECAPWAGQVNPARRQSALRRPPEDRLPQPPFGEKIV